MNKVEELVEILGTGTQLAETMLDILKQQQDAIIQFKSSTLADLLRRQQELIEPIQQVERKRLEVAGELHTARIPGGRRQAVPTLDSLVESLEEDEAERVTEYGRKLHGVVDQVLHINAQNKMLLENSLRFIQHNLRIITDNYSKRLVDAKL